MFDTSIPTNVLASFPFSPPTVPGLADASSLKTFPLQSTSVFSNASMQTHSLTPVPLQRHPLLYHGRGDSFFCKFKNLLHSGKNAQLEIKSEAGKAFVKLTAEVEATSPPGVRFRNGPARQRRREKRAADRADAVKAADPESEPVGNATEEEADVSGEQVPATLAVKAN